jgi:hypothetical protein
MPDILSGESLRGRRVTECPPSGSRQNVGAPYACILLVMSVVLAFFTAEAQREKVRSQRGDEMSLLGCAAE